MGAFDNATLVEPEDNTTPNSNTPTNFFANAQLVTEEQPASANWLTGGSPLDKSLGGVTSYNPDTNTYSVGPADINPLISAKEDPTIMKILKNKDQRTVFDNDWTHFKNADNTPIEFEQGTSLEDKFKIFDQNDGRVILFNDDTTHHVDFRAIGDKYVYNVAGVEPPVEQPNWLDVVTSPLVPDFKQRADVWREYRKNKKLIQAGKIDKLAVTSENRNVFKLVEHLRNELNITDEKVIAALAKREFHQGPYSSFKEGALATGQFAAQIVAWSVGEVANNAIWATTKFTTGLVGYQDYDQPNHIGMDIYPFGKTITTGEGREDLLNQFLPNMARLLQRDLKAGGVDVTIEQAEGIMSWSPNWKEKIKKFTGEALPITAPLGYMRWANRVAIGKEFDAFKKLGKYETHGDAAEAFLNHKIKEDNAMKRIIMSDSMRKNVYEDRLVGSEELLQMKLPLSQQRVYKNQIGVIKSIKKRMDLAKPSKMSQTDWENTPKYKDFMRQIREEQSALEVIKLGKDVPKFLKEDLKAESTVILFGATAGEIFSQAGFDQSTGELLGIFAGVSRASKILPEGWMEKLGTTGGIEYLTEGTSYLLLAALERTVKEKGYYLRDTSIYKKLNATQIKQVESLAAGVNNLAPELKEEVMQRVQVFFDSKDALIEAGVDEDMLNTTLSKVTGLAILELAEQNVKAQLNAGEALNPKMMQKFQEIITKKDGINQELSNVMATLIPKLKGMKEGDPLNAFVEKLTSSVEASRTNNEKLVEALNSAQELLLENATRKTLDTSLSTGQLTSDLSTIYSMTGVQIGKLDAKQAVDQILKIETSINTQMLNKISELRLTAKVPEDLETIDNYLEIIAFNKQASLKEQGKLLYTQLDKDFADLGANSDASVLFDRVMDYILDRSKPAKKIGNLTVAQSVANDLLDQFDIAAQRSLDEFLGGESESFYVDLVDKMKQLGYKNKDIRPSTVIDFIKKDLNINIPVKLNYTEVEALTSGLKGKAFDAKQNLSPAAAQYDVFAKDAESLFENFKLKDGTDIGGELSVRHKEASDAYKALYADRALEGTLGQKWLTSVRNPNVSEIEGVGRRWKTPIKDWISIDKIAKNEDDASLLNNDLRIFFGKQGKDEKSGKITYTLTDENEFGGAIGEVGRYKTIKWLTKQFKSGKNLNDISDQLDNIKKTFGGTGFDPYDLIDHGGWFSFEQASKRSDKIKKLKATANRNAKLTLNKQIGDAKAFQRSMKKNIDWFATNVKKQIGEPQSLFNFFVNAPPQNYNDLKNIAVKTKAMTAKEFDMTVKHVIGRQINDAVMKQTGRNILFKGNEKVAASVFDVDFNSLTEILAGNPQRAENLKRILGKSHYDTLVNITQFLAIEKGKPIYDMAMTGIPRGLSVESWISRVYAVNRNVVSKRYVATEAAIQAARLNNFSILEEMITNPDAAKLFGDIIISGKPLTDELNARITGIIMTGIARVNARGPESKTFSQVGSAAVNFLGYTAGKAKDFGKSAIDASGFFE